MRDAYKVSEDIAKQYFTKTVKPEPPIVENIEETPPEPEDDYVKPVVIQTIPHKIMNYYKEIDEKLVALTDAFKSITNPYFTEDVMEPDHEVFGVEKFRMTMTEDQVKNRFLKMLQISAYLHSSALLALKSGLTSKYGKV